MYFAVSISGRTLAAINVALQRSGMPIDSSASKGIS
jgi:hypothetical protein